MRDGYSNFGFFQALTPDVYDSDTDGDTIDLRGYDTAVILANIGTQNSAGDDSATSKYELALEHALSDADGSLYWSEVAASQVLHSVIGPGSGFASGYFQTIGSTLSNAYQSNVYAIGYKGSRRWIRLRLEATGAPSALAAGAIALLGLPANWPVNVPENE